MAHLVLANGDGKTERFQIRQEQTTLGRAPAADICIRDPKASSTHCRIEKISTGGYRVLDLESQNGTWLNGKRIRRHTLKPGDTIGIGATELQFEEAEPTRTSRRERKAAEKSTHELEEAVANFLQVADQEDRVAVAARIEESCSEIASALVDREVMRLRKLVSWIRRLNTEHDHARLLSLMLDSVVELTGAERGFLMLKEGPRRRDLKIRVVKRFDPDALRKPTFRVARAIAESVARKGQPVVSTNADEDPRIQSFGDTGALYLRSVVCVPIRSGRTLLGALYLDNRFERGVFEDEDLPFLLSFADQAAVALRNAQLHEEAERARKEVEQLNGVLRGRVEKQEAELNEVKTLYARANAEARSKYSYDAIVGETPVMRELFFLLDRVTDSDVPVYISGESGAGKELAARAIHFNGPRGEGPFVSENCAAIPESLFESELFGHVRGAFTGAVADKKGLFQLAVGGTLFLDEIAEIPPSLQARLLRVLQEREVRPVGGKKAVSIDVRIVTASNRDLAEEVRRGRFREDLYHRIHVIEVAIPPLKRRREDIPLLVAHFLKKIARERPRGEVRTLSAAALDLIRRYEWPGNVRELENEILRAWTLSDGEIGPEHLGDAVRGAATASRYADSTLKEAVRLATRELERNLIVEALRSENGNKSAVARHLGISRPTLDAKMESLKIPRFPA